jgi:hypothetical protein
MRKFFWQLLALVLLSALIGCSETTVVAGKNGIRVKPGEWSAETEDGHIADFTITFDGTNILVYTYSYPCDGKFSYVLPSKPIKTELNNSAFEMTVDYTDFNTKFILTGKFIDSTHAEGTWESFKFHSIYLDTVCSAAKGTWKGSPK